MKTNIEEIRIIPLRAIKNKKGTLVALATCVLDCKFFVGSIGIYEVAKEEFLEENDKNDYKGYRITYPTKKSGFSSYKQFFPVNDEVRSDIDKVIIDEYLNLLSKDV